MLAEQKQQTTNYKECTIDEQLGGKRMDEREVSRKVGARRETGERSEETNKCSDEECGEERRVRAA
jgi:hypothetical protein